jgi:hypothetical protein
VRRASLAGRLKEAERLVIERNPELREKFLGPEVVLDPFLVRVLDMFWILRRGTPSERGIPITLADLRELDPTLLELLLEADSAFLEEAAKQNEARSKSIKAPGK